MARLLWGKVFFKELFAGYLREEPGDRIAFAYDESYITAGHPAIAHTLPVCEAPYISHNGLHPFFDNLVSEGWLEQAQSHLLGKRNVSRFELLLAFGLDCAGAVSVVDPEPFPLNEALLNLDDPREKAVLINRASLSGVQPKLAVIEDGGCFRPARIDEFSTHIAKFPSANHPDLMENEYLTTRAIKALLADEDVVELTIGSIQGVDEPALLIKRFDRNPVERQRVHFEEFNQLLNHRSKAKYEGAYKAMAEFILQTDACLPIQTYTLYRRILAGLLLGNTDMHFKNFAMFHTPQGLRFTPSYDQVCAALYTYKTLALSIAGAADLLIGQLKPANIIKLGEEFALSPAAMNLAIEGLCKNLNSAKQAIAEAKWGSADLKNNLIKFMETRWNGTFALIGQALSKKR